MQPGLINPNRGLQPRKDPATNENLIKPIASAKIAYPPGFWSGLAVDLIVIFLACAFGYLYFRYLVDGGKFIWYAMVIAALLLMVSLFDTLLTKSFGRRVVIVLAEVIVMSLWFIKSGVFNFTVSVAAATAFFMLWGELQSRREMNNGLEMQFFKISKYQINKGITALILFVVLSYLPLYSYDRIFLSENVFASVYGWAASVVKGMYPELELTSSLNEFVGSITNLKAREDPEFESLPANAQKLILGQLNSQTIEFIKGKININISETQPMHLIFYNYLQNMVQNWERQFGDRFLATWAIIVFFILRSLGFILYLAVSILSFFVYQILLATDFIKIVGESCTHETLEYK
ncbi:MAG: hypothetical protein V1856_03660 [Candidatus Liptonbacteria bacterium]